MTTGEGKLSIAPEPEQHPAKPVPEPPSLGPCRWIIDTATNKECGGKGIHKVRVDTREVPAMIILCASHRWEMNQSYAARRQEHKNAQAS